jgi:hypothetical protein
MAMDYLEPQRNALNIEGEEEGEDDETVMHLNSSLHILDLPTLSHTRCPAKTSR